MVKIMNKKEILELRKTFRPEECNISRIATCYVTSEKEKILEKSQAFLSLPEEEAFKYFDILKQALSGTVGKNLYTLKTNSIHPADESPQKLETLRKYHMNDEGMLTDLFDSIIGSYDSSENYLIIVVNGLYDIPGVTSDDQELEDASDEVYSYILTCICPVELDEPGLSIDCTKPAILDKDANPFVIVYRTNDPATYGKAFTCFSEKTVKIEQSCIFDYKDALAKIEPNIIRSWQYTHTRTDIDFSYPARSINLKQKCKITLGTRLSFSDIGECAFRLQNCIFTNGGTILLPQEASRKKSNKLSPEGIVKDYNSQCYMKFDKIMEQLKSYETIPVTDMQQSVWNILEKLKFSSAFGFSNTRDLQKNYLSTFEKEGDALDVVIKILKIPGVLQRNYPGTTHDRVNECIGKIFNLKMEKLIV